MEKEERNVMPLFEVAMLEQPTPEQAKEGAGDKLVYGPVPVVARDSQAAAIGAMMRDDRPKDINVERLQVLVRPFV